MTAAVTYQNVEYVKGYEYFLKALFSPLILIVSPSENLASGGIAVHSSQYDSHGAASNAIDRKRNPLYHAGSCSHTEAETNPWWRVDLLDTYQVTFVTITNRGDCCLHRINGAEIRIGNSLENNGTTNPLCAVISEMREGQPMDIPCNIVSLHVTIVLPGREKYLALCEVEVYGESDDPNQSEMTHFTGKSK
ncbi:fucolectin [Salmo salar]|uniref:Fucolectin n=1 Tax=Salmo salar TaxID=8030 RepID=A0A1S3RWJ7_SALSA|nr:fucolectin [Salmo salar]|eukprot:XP_014056169.1 PREDICTED: fucolectin-like [Salmo salar]